MLHAIQNMKSQIDCFIDTVEITLLILSQCENNIVVGYHFYSNNKIMCFTSEYIIKNCLLWIDSLSFVSFCNNFRLFSSPTSYPQEKNSSQKVYVKTVSAFRIFLNEKVLICWVLIESHVMYLLGINHETLFYSVVIPILKNHKYLLFHSSLQFS